MTDVLVKYQEKFKDCQTAVRGEDESNKKNEKQSEKMVSFDELVTVRDRVKKEIDEAVSITKQTYAKVQAYMLLCIATMLPETRRTSDYTEMYVYDGFDIDKTHNDDKSKNYYMTEFGKMVFNVYKGSGVKGQHTVWLPTELNDILKDYLSYSPHHQGRHNGTPFLVGITGGPCANNGGAVQRLFESVGLNLGMSTIRNIVATHRDGDNVKRLKELEESEAVREYRQVMERLAENAKLMCHSTAVHIKYVRFDENALTTP
jgi:hypothetical protein